LLPARHAERPRSGLFFWGAFLPPEPSVRRAVAFIDGQNLFHAVRETFGYRYPNYDVSALAHAVCQARSWHLVQPRFYTGVPDRRTNPAWHQFWLHKLAAMGRHKVHVFSRPLRYRTRTFRLPDGSAHSFLAGEEKGIDVRLALDAVRMAHRCEYDVALILSQDQDLSEVAEEIRSIAREQRRWIKIASAFPASPEAPNRRGIDKTDWIRIDRATYDACLDRRDYRRSAPPPSAGGR
jgi:uncharacterized LabA/DUF88 family protein